MTNSLAGTVPVPRGYGEKHGIVTMPANKKPENLAAICTSIRVLSPQNNLYDRNNQTSLAVSVYPGSTGKLLGILTSGITRQILPTPRRSSIANVTQPFSIGFQT